MKNISQKSEGMPEYLAKILDGIANGEFKQQIGVNHIVVHHDSQCSIFKNAICNCDPDISF